MIEINKLTKVYKGGKGIFDVSFQVAEGEAFGYLGPNGAGKTTTIRNLLGFIFPDGGHCMVAGLDARTDAAGIHAKVGYIPGEMAFFDDMTGIQFLEFVSALRGRSLKQLRDKLIERFELTHETRIRKMSKGNKQKLGLVTAFMHDPGVYVLDEPTSGLDPLMQQRFVDLILEEKSRGKTILMSSHMFEEVDRTCDRAGIIREGKLVDVEDVKLLKTMQQRRYVVHLESQADVDRLVDSRLAATVQDKRVEITVTDDYGPMLRVLASCQVGGLEAVSQSLEDVFMQYYGKEVRQQ